jgi:predicted acyl esterase
MLALGFALDGATGTWGLSTDDASRFMVAVRQIAFADVMLPGTTKASMIEQLADEAGLQNRVAESDWIAVQRHTSSEMLKDLRPDNEAPRRHSRGHRRP